MPIGRIRLLTGLIATVLGALAPAAQATDCQLACSKSLCEPRCPGGACKLVDLANKPVQLGRDAFTSVRGCDALAANVNLELRYRHKGRWFAPPGGLEDGKRLIEIFEKFPPDPCSVASRECLQQAMNSQQAAVGGHGIDNRASKPGGEGEPCRLGLPCAALIAPPAAWRFRLSDPALTGTWLVRLARGEPPPGQAPELAAKVARGVVEGNGAWFAPGAQYVYRLVDSAGQERARGEFRLVSQPTADSLKTLSQRRIDAGMSPALAWIDTLSANNLDWNAQQLSPPEGITP